MSDKTIVIGSDHAGYDAKIEVVPYLIELGYVALDVGCDNAKDSVHYPDFAKRSALAIKEGRAARGLLFCGSGIGICIAANRYPWIRAATVYNATIAFYTRDHNDANVACFGGQHMGSAQIRDCVRVFLQTPFSGGARHQKRIDMLTNGC